MKNIRQTPSLGCTVRILVITLQLHNMAVKKMSHIAKTANPYGLPQLNHAGSHKKFCKLTSFQGFQLRLRTGHFCRQLNHNDLKLPGINP